MKPVSLGPVRGFPARHGGAWLPRLLWRLRCHRARAP